MSCTLFTILFSHENIIQIVSGTEGHLSQSAMIDLLYYTQPKTTSIRTQLDALYGHS
jgi:hypothetical protein